MTTQTYQIVYGILAHTDPDQFAKLINKLASSEVIFYVHIDIKSNQKLFEQVVEGLPVKFIKKRVHAKWGSFNIVQSQLNIFDELIHDEIQFSHFIILSGQDYPLVSNDKIIDFFSNHQDTNFFHWGLMHSDGSEHLKKRFELYYFYIFNTWHISVPYAGKNKIIKFFAQLLSLFLPWKIKNEYSINNLYFGSNWYKISSKALKFIYNYVKSHPKKIAFFKTCNVPDEFFFQTILLNATEEEVGKNCNNNLHFTHWQRPASLYTIPLNEEDFERIDFSNQFFARKFDSSKSKKLIELIDNQTVKNKLKNN